MATKTAAQVVNTQLLEQLANPSMRKKAEDAINDYTRSVLREDGAFRKILPVQEISDDELDVQLGTDLPVKIVFKEPLTVGALTVPFAGSPRTFVIRGPNYPVYFTEIKGPNQMKHINELRVYPFDIRQVLTDHAIRDIMEEEDKRWFTDTVDVALVGADQVSPFTNQIQWRTLYGGWTRANVAEAMKTLPRGFAKVKADKIVINSVTVYEFQKWGRDEMGGDMSQDLLKNGRSEGSWLSGDFMQAEWLVTIKHNLVADNTMYQFATPQFLGKAYEMTPVTMFMDRRGEMLEFHPYETIGAALGNLAGVGRVDMAS